MKIKVGDKVRHSILGGQILTGNIQGIEICREGEKSGRSVRSCDTKKHQGIVDLDNEHWCYFYQVKEVLK